MVDGCTYVHARKSRRFGIAMHQQYLVPFIHDDEARRRSWCGRSRGRCRIHG